MPAKFVLNSNIGGKIRASIMEEDLDKLTMEDWAELNKRNVHVCIIRKPGQFIRPSIYEEIHDQMIKAMEEGIPEGTPLPDDLIQFE